MSTIGKKHQSILLIWACKLNWKALSMDMTWFNEEMIMVKTASEGQSDLILNIHRQNPRSMQGQFLL